MRSQDIPIDYQTEDGETKLINAREKLFKDAMKGRWQDVADTYGKDKKVHETKITWAGDTLLHLAVSSGVEKNVTLLMDCIRKEPEEYRCKILKTQNERGDTALHIAAALGMVGVCLDMAKLHPTMVVQSFNGRKETPLFKAVRHGQKKAFFALHFVVAREGRLGREGPWREGLRREGGDTILHNAIFAEHFDLALEIIHCYPVLVNAMNEKGESPLHVLANKPSAFKSGSRFSLYDSIIYHCIIVDPLKVKYEKYSKKFSKNNFIDGVKALHKGNHNIPDNYQPCYNIFTLLKDVFKNIDAVPNMDTMDGDPETGVGAQQNGSQNRQRYPKNYYTCFNFFKLVVKFLLIIIGIGLWKVQAMKKRKQTNTHAYQIMEVLVERIQKEYHYGKDGMKPETTPRESMPPTVLGPPKVVDEPTSQKIQDGPSKQEAETSIKQFEDDSKEKPVGATPILVAAKRGVLEMVDKILEDMPVAALDQDQDEKNIILLAVENRQPRVYELMLKRKLMRTAVFSAVDKGGNSALHLAARHGSNRPWLIPGAALQMQWEIKWYKYVLKSMGPEFFMQHNMKGETALEIFTRTHEPLVKDAGKWLNNTSQSCSVVAALIATVAFASATAVPGGVNQESGFPIFEGKPAFQVFALSALIALCFSITSLVMFLSILTSRFEERDFEKDLPGKLIIGLTTLFMSIGANLVSFCAGHFFVIEEKLKYAAYPIYAVVCLPISFFAVAQFPLYIDLIKATFAEVPERTQKLHPF